MATVEYRGCRGLVFAEITKDDSTGYTTGDVTVLAPVAEIAKTVETASESHYYDNKAAIIINTEGTDTVTFTIAVPTDAVLAKITGRTYDSTAKRFIESERVQKYFAVGYILGESSSAGDDERFVWRYKGTFNIPDETSATKDDGTDANNMSLEFTGIFTEHSFTNGKGTGVAGCAKAMAIDKSAGVCTETQFFSAVATPDTTFTSNP